MVMIRDLWRTISGIAISNRLRATPHWPKEGSRGTSQHRKSIAEINSMASIGGIEALFIGAPLSG
jgi:hypothetical protein